MALDPLPSEFAEGIFNELTGLDVPLDDDPLLFGPKRLNGKVALSRRMLSRCESVFNKISQLLSRYKRELRAEELMLSLERKQLLANEPEVRAGRSASDRDAIATGLLREKVELVAGLDHTVQELEDLLSVVKAKRADLRDIQGRLRDQIHLCGEELSLKGQWGSKPVRETELSPRPEPANFDYLDRALETVKAESHKIHAVNASDPTEEIEEDLLTPTFASEPAPLPDLKPAKSTPSFIVPTSNDVEVEAFLNVRLSTKVEKAKVDTVDLFQFEESLGGLFD